MLTRVYLFLIAELEDSLANTQADMDRLVSKVDAVLVAFESEEVPQRLDAAWDRLQMFVKKAAQDAMQLVMALMKSHNSERTWILWAAPMPSGRLTSAPLDLLPSISWTK